MSINLNLFSSPYLAVIALPATPPVEAKATDIRYCEWRLVGEYHDRATALNHAYDAAVAHDADSYTVIDPKAERYAAIRARLSNRPLASMGAIA